MEKLFHAKVISAFFAGLFRWIYPFQRVWSTEAVYSCSHKHPMTTYFTIKTKCFSLSCYHLACVLSLWRHKECFNQIFIFEFLMMRRRRVPEDGRCVCVMSAAPGRLCSTSHTVHTPSQSLYHSPASENKQKPLNTPDQRQHIWNVLIIGYEHI